MNPPTVTYNIEKTSSGFIGQCVQFPQIFTEAKTETALKKEMDVVLDGYFKACPQARKMIKKNVGHGTYEIKKNA
jgi:predicted RNase H-like HicB family nuclease